MVLFFSRMLMRRRKSHKFYLVLFHRHFVPLYKGSRGHYKDPTFSSNAKQISEGLK